MAGRHWRAAPRTRRRRPVSEALAAGTGGPNLRPGGRRGRACAPMRRRSPTRSQEPYPEARRAGGGGGGRGGPRLRAEAAQVAHQVREQLAHERRHMALQRRRRQRGARAAQPAPHVAQQRVCVPARGHTQGWHAGPERDA